MTSGCARPERMLGMMCPSGQSAAGVSRCAVPSAPRPASRVAGRPAGGPVVRPCEPRSSGLPSAMLRKAARVDSLPRGSRERQPSAAVVPAPWCPLPGARRAFRESGCRLGVCPHRGASGACVRLDTRSCAALASTAFRRIWVYSDVSHESVRRRAVSPRRAGQPKQPRFPSASWLR
jgi:hypothetical protein